MSRCSASSLSLAGSSLRQLDGAYWTPSAPSSPSDPKSVIIALETSQQSSFHTSADHPVLGLGGGAGCAIVLATPLDRNRLLPGFQDLDKAFTGVLEKYRLSPRYLESMEWAD